MGFCLHPLAHPPQSLRDCAPTLTEVLLQQMQWTRTPHREHVDYFIHINYQKIIWAHIKTLLLLCQSIKKEIKQTPPQNCRLFRTGAVLWTYFAFCHLL